MKTIRKIGMALFAVLMSVNFASCSKDEDDPMNQSNNEKKLVRVMEYYDDKSLACIYEFLYNKQEKVIETNYTSRDCYSDPWETKTTKFIWNSNKSITVIEDGVEGNVQLSNGRINELGAYSFSYNKDGKINKFEEKGDYFNSTIAYTWQDGKLSLFDYQSGSFGYSNSIRYSNNQCKGFFPLFGKVVRLELHCLFIAHPELVGAKTNYLPSKISSDDISHTYTFNYELDSEGYMNRCTLLELFEGEYYTTYYEFVWE